MVSSECLRIGMLPGIFGSIKHQPHAKSILANALAQLRQKPPTKRLPSLSSSQWNENPPLTT